ncbi:hypothetical protein ACFOMH_08265 [Paracoccus mangrovi]|uniref:Uncharacterized protein n=1 Tax=Paracoccus mangrovi TaxID=1715645 RepID=A0ABV7R485_9RHOB
MVRKDIDGTRKTWLLTGYEARTEKSKQRIAGGSTGSTDGLPDGSSPSAPLHPEDSLHGPDFQENVALPEEAEIAEAIAHARAMLAEDPDLTLRMGDGDDAREASLSDLLDDMDRDDARMRGLTSCNLKGSPK